ncbi:MAG: toll/interleukin-1 receptor domain-containing protein [Clostridia bacterium]|nr:toll/interleukin-1 receptor domain-containing protein [Clostridia bacterium]
MNHQAFISYSSKDKAVADAVLHWLEGDGIRCWIAPRNAVPGVAYTESIVDAIHTCKVFVLIYSQNSDKSKHVMSEINSAFNSGCIIVPLRIENIDPSKTYEYYIGSTHWLDALTPPIENYLDSLVETVKGVLEAKTDTPLEKIQTVTPKGRVSSGGIRMVTYEELLDMGIRPERIASKLIENDYVNYGAGANEENEGTPELWMEMLSSFTETYRYMIDGDEIVGDWSITALDDDKFEEMKAGKTVSKDLTLEYTEVISMPGEYNGVIITMYMLPRYRKGKNYRLLLTSFLKQVEEYAREDIFFKEWCINAFTRQQHAFFESVGFEYRCDHRLYGRIYTISKEKLLSLPIMKEFPEMKELYKNK